MDHLLLLPPIAFIVVFVVMLIQLKGMTIFSRGLKSSDKAGTYKAYACGEDVKDHRAQPDYSQFFPFAFFFTIMHVVALVVATIPGNSIPAVALATLYVTGAVIGLFILFRR